MAAADSARCTWTLSVVIGSPCPRCVACEPLGGERVAGACEHDQLVDANLGVHPRAGADPVDDALCVRHASIVACDDIECQWL